MSDVPGWVYSILEKFITRINVSYLKVLVDNDFSLLNFTLNHPNNDTVFFWLKFFSPFIDLENISERKVLDLIKKNRSDVYFVLINNEGWLHRQFVEISFYLKNN